jgi:hypothetical protein
VYNSGVQTGSRRDQLRERRPHPPWLKIQDFCGHVTGLRQAGSCRVQLSSDAGVLLQAEVERKLGIAERLARCVADPRAPQQIEHSVAEMIRFRALAIAAGYADANDCDALRKDPAFKMAVRRLPETGVDLCSQPTMTRLEKPAKPGRAEAHGGGDDRAAEFHARRQK